MTTIWRLFLGGGVWQPPTTTADPSRGWQGDPTVKGFTDREQLLQLLETYVIPALAGRS